jgi:predicted ATPase/DNA-binding SARP family transcriptional activator
MLRIKLLGRPVLEADGRRVDLSSGKGLALLCYLAARPDAAVPRAQLVDLLWEGYPESAGRHSLSSLLTRLRDALPCWPLRAPGDALGWDPAAPVETDVARFEALVTAGHLAAAAALWRGPFLEGPAPADGEVYEEWLRAERRVWEVRVLDVLARLAEEAQAAGDWASAAGHARRGLVVDPLQEGLHRALMLALHRTGDRAGALAQYEHCRELLRSELGVEPDAATVRLRDNLVRPAPSPQPRDVSEPLDPRTNLPAPTSPLIGREREVVAACALLGRPGVRLVTLTGAGGVGKTRLALGVAEQAYAGFPDGVYLISLAAIGDPALVGSAVARGLGLYELGGRPPLEGLTRRIGGRRLLLVLDNFEHVAAAATLLAELLAACPRLSVLVTSRAPLRLSGEHEFQVPPLSLPEPAEPPRLELVLESEAVRLFVERANAVSRDFALTDENAAAVVGVCQRLDGLALALELAAAHARVFSPEQLLARLERQLPLLTGGARDLPGRQQTMRATIDWSCRLLGEPERVLFRRLAVFVGGFTLEAAEAICNLDGDLDVASVAESLVAQNLLLRAEAAGEPRLRMLTVIREYALELAAASGEADGLRRRHARFYGALIDQAEAQLQGPRQREWFQRLETEHGNLRAALDWHADHEPVTGLRLAAKLTWFWTLRGYAMEGLARLRAMLARVAADPVAGPDPGPRADALTAAGYFLISSGDLRGARAMLEEALASRRAMGDGRGEALTLTTLTVAIGRRGDPDAARLLDETLAAWRELDDAPRGLLTLSDLAEVAQWFGDVARATALHDESLRRSRSEGDVHGAAKALRNLGHQALLAGDTGRAGAMLRESLSLVWELRDKMCSMGCLRELALVAGAQDRADVSLRLLGASEAVREEMGIVPTEAARVELERTMIRLRGEVGEGAARDLAAEGRTMTLGQAVAYALSDVG